MKLYIFNNVMKRDAPGIFRGHFLDLENLARLEGFEPTTPGSEDRCSVR
jgi:hypothetical protein